VLCCGGNDAKTAEFSLIDHRSTSTIGNKLFCTNIDTVATTPAVVVVEGIDNDDRLNTVKLANNMNWTVAELQSTAVQASVTAPSYDVAELELVNQDCGIDDADISDEL